MKRLAVAVLSGALLAGCGGGSGGSGPDLAACKDAMRAQYAAAQSSGATGSRPAECRGVSDADLQRIAGEIVGEQLGG